MRPLPQAARQSTWNTRHRRTCARPGISRCIGMPWGEAAFARAQAEDKPILLDIGAVWCHWCHVMDRRVVRRSRGRHAHQRAFCRGEGRSRRAARRGCALPGCGFGHQRTGRLAADGISHSRWTALFRRNVYSARRSLRPAGHWPRAAGDGAGVARPPRRGAGNSRQRDGRHRA